MRLRTIEPTTADVAKQSSATAKTAVAIHRQRRRVQAMMALLDGINLISVANKAKPRPAVAPIPNFFPKICNTTPRFAADV